MSASGAPPAEMEGGTSGTAVPAGPGVRPRVIQPGLVPFGAGVEHYRALGGGVTVVRIRPGDRITITDVEGGQRGELVVFGERGGDDAAALGTRSGGEATGTHAILGRGGEDAAAVRASLERNGLDLHAARAVRLFGEQSRAGESATFPAERPVTCLIAAPGGPMRVDAQNPPTELAVRVDRAHVDSEQDARPLPPPLAEPRLDLRVNRATAEAYCVRAGEYIQVIDVAGRQCSDFVAFDARKLQQGTECGLDATVTRSLMGKAPAPPALGLYSRFYDMEMEGLIEVVRDTVGRHDTFNLACFPKYYEDQGYPGHPNCTDNFNYVLNPSGVAPRKGWAAVNFFYNTAVDACNVVIDDESWSRPGDYVLLRALTDLVCASSACPDDTGAANGWNPTDIHVRVYPARNMFSRGVAFRMSPDSMPRLTRESGFHERTSALTRHFGDQNGYWLPTRYTNQGVIDEYWACREKAAVMDLSALRKFEVLGPDAEDLLQWVLTRNVRRLAVGQVGYSALCYEHGGMIDDGTVFRLGERNFRWIGGAEFAGTWLRRQAEARGFNALIKSSTDQLHNIAVQGPASRDILKAIVWTPPEQPKLEELRWFRFTIGRIGQHDGIPIVVSRTGYTGELGYEIWCHPRDAVAVWDAVRAAGDPFGLLPLGFDALDVVRIEAGLALSGHEFDDQTDPFEAGIGFAVHLANNDEPFVGREALERRSAHPQRALVGLTLDGKEAVGHGDPVYAGRAQVGVITSATHSPVLHTTVALCRVDAAYLEPGTALEIGKLDGHQKRLPATVARYPFYDPDKTRIRS